MFILQHVQVVWVYRLICFKSPDDVPHLRLLGMSYLTFVTKECSLDIQVVLCPEHLVTDSTFMHF